MRCRGEYTTHLRGALGGIGVFWLIVRMLVGSPPYAIVGDMIAGVFILMALPVVEELLLFTPMTATFPLLFENIIRRLVRGGRRGNR